MRHRRLLGFILSVLMFFSFPLSVVTNNFMPDLVLKVSAAYENTHANTGNQIEDIIAVAQTQVGYLEGSDSGTSLTADNYTKYNKWLGTINNSYKYAWCESFISWCANQAGIPSSIIPYTAGTGTAISFFTSQGTYHKKSTGYTPKRGDILYVSGAGDGHVALIIAVNGSSMTTIEGNTGVGQVNRYTHRTTNDSDIWGYASPNYNGGNNSPPGWAKVSIDKKSYKVGEDVTFNLSSDTGYSYTVGIDSEDGERTRIDTQQLGINAPHFYTRSFNSPGNYSCYITTYNDYGLADSERIYFSVYDSKPGWAKVSVDKKSYKVGEDVIFYLSSDTGYSYTVGIDSEDGERTRIDTQQLGTNALHIYSRSFNSPGNYSCYVTTYNDYGLADSERIYFSVYDSKPKWAKVSIDKESYKVGENVTFYMSSDTGYSYTVGIDSENGERTRIDTQQLGTNDLHIYTRSFDSLGVYSCYVTTYNDYGLADSQRIYFTIYADLNTSFDGNGGSCSILNKSVTYAKTYGDLPIPTRNGYTFNGWYTAKEGGTKVTSDTIVTATKNHILYAHWTAKSVEVQFYRNHDSNDTSSVKESFTYDVKNQKFGYKTDGSGRYNKMNDPSVGFGEWIKTGYSLLGWSENRTSTSETYSTYSGVSNEWIDSKSPSVNLYAIWKPNTYNVNLIYNDGTEKTETINVTYDSSYNIPDATRTGYIFDGWYTSKNGGTKITADTKVSITENQTLYAHWEKVNVLGDSNDDGEFTVADVVMLQKWLLSKGTLTNWQNADLCKDGVINVFDLVMMKKKLIYG